MQLTQNIISKQHKRTKNTNISQLLLLYRIITTLCLKKCANFGRL